MTEDYSAPLGLDRPGTARRAASLWPVFAGLAALVVAGLAGWALVNPDPYGGQPHVVLDLPPAPPPVAAPEQAPPPPEQPDDPDGQIIIRDP